MKNNMRNVKVTETHKSTGVFMLGLLGLLFVGLKLTEHINWSWWWVTLPFWGGIAIFLIGVFIVFCVYLISIFLAKRRLKSYHQKNLKN